MTRLKRVASDSRVLKVRCVKFFHKRPLLLLLLLILIVIQTWAIVSSALSNLKQNSLGWNSALFLSLWIVLGIVAGVIVHSLFAAFAKWLSQDEWSSIRPHEIAGHFLGVVGVIYAVLVTFVVVTAWQGRDRAEQLTIQEQHSVDDLFHLEVAYPSHEASLIRFMLRDYTVDTVAEWDQMRKGRILCRNLAEPNVGCWTSQGVISQRAVELAHCIVGLTSALRMSKPNEEITRQNQVIYQEGIRLSQNLSENQEERRLRYREGTLPPILWSTFVLGALILVGMTYLITGQNPRDQLVRTSALFAMIAMMLAVAFVFDRPFEGGKQISGDTWGEMAVQFNQELAYAESPYNYLPADCYAR
jgi:hypothetical protein